jgi:hypothetical protein
MTTNYYYYFSCRLKRQKIGCECELDITKLTVDSNVTMVGEAELHDFQAVWFVKNILHLDTLIQGIAGFLFTEIGLLSVKSVVKMPDFFAAYGCSN